MATKPQLKRFGVFGLIATAACVATLLAVRARAAGIPDADVLTYTGYLEGADGQPLTSELSSIGLEVWDAAEAGERVCDTSVEGVAPQAGRFQLVLPAECVDAVKATPNLWVDVKVDGASLGRTKLGAVPYAIEAGHSHSADNALAAETSATLLAASSGMLVGEAPAGTQFVVQAGTADGTSNADGTLAVPFPKAFANGVASVVITNAFSQNQYAEVRGIMDTVSKSGFTVQMSPMQLTRINYIAFGW
jgi:hypothetical protein